ncbi:glucose dehydrogenase [Xanthomonas translucens pv. arrhenatheri]|uniref:Dehydrogenase n=1 Tax=Xanthomonas graminis pv. arrhenatheri LMG 727 TaxID=1195923 RepID=A0A0K2ZDR1_9XANT|nr:PQQ-dependent sugar dehydrogenase [Xanthomonas translucens]OAX63609.1 glucose dehydrogenase [Xanthomonas translucens pv. arrhenatheri]UKE78107.1 PQQ-dependent sugar dehydrogenase [Xanthomonas translucens pv. arrhenatheri]CTP82927.1 dehydrogenase [Xanthomonas translucens pv. arrhenatheri LMG 727]
MQRSSLGLVCALLLSLAASAADAAPAANSAERRCDWPFSATPFATFNEPWAMSFLPDGSALVTEKGGTLKRFDPASGRTGTVSGVPAVDYGGQGGLGDVLPHPDFAQNGWLYLSYVEAGSEDTRGAAVARAKLTLDANGGGALSQLQVIWRQQPKVSGSGHYGHRLAFGPDGKLWISSSERQKFDPAQDMNSNLGKIVRLNDDGSVPADNPFARRGGVAAQVWSLGHRNVLGLAFDANGQLWEHEMGPAGGDELNLIQRGANYGYPIVSNGNHYDGRPIPDHSTRPEFAAPKLSWTPVISPAGFVIYSGSAFPQWRGNGFIGGMSSQSLLRIEFDGNHAREAARYDMGKRIREVEQGPDGALWLLEDGSSGRLLKLQPLQS